MITLANLTHAGMSHRMSKCVVCLSTDSIPSYFENIEPINMIKNILKALIASASTIAFVSCASTVPSAKITDAIEPEILVTAEDTVNVKLTTAPGVNLRNYDRSRFTDKLNYELKKEKAHIPTTRAPKTFNTTVQITEFDKGNATARYLAAGLGQIKIKSTVTHKDNSGNTGAFRVNKTFAWGGMYGAFTDVEDIEESLIDSIVRTLTKGK